MTITITDNKLEEIIDTLDPILVDPWRWGDKRSFVFEQDGKHFMVTAFFHVEEGLQRSGEHKAYEVKPVERTIIDWVKV